MSPKLITGEKHQPGFAPILRITGYLVQCPNLNGLGADSLVPVTLLTAEGEKIRNVLVRVVDVAGEKIRDFSLFTDYMLWRVAEIDMGGQSDRALTELAYRESLEIKERVRVRSAKLEGSQRAAAMLMGRV